MDHADRQSTYQAQSNAMFHSSSFPGSFEIVAQSWMSNANVVDVAIDLVNLWRSSPPHWGAASTAWSRYGVDMQSNGSVWYATRHLSMTGVQRSRRAASVSWRVG